MSHRPATGWLMVCRKGLPALQWGPYGVATAAPLHCDSGPVAEPGGPYGRKTMLFPVKTGHQKSDEIFVLEEPGGPYGTFSPVFRTGK